MNPWFKHVCKGSPPSALCASAAQLVFFVQEGGEMQQRPRLEFIEDASRRMFAAAVSAGRGVATAVSAPEREQISYGDL